jgi:amidase
VRGPLHGIPVLIKDNIDTGDHMMTTAGSLALEGNKSIEDAFVVKQLRKAGAVLLGKTNLSEWANFRSTRSTSGWSSRGGQTRNPYALDRNPSGSSSGSGASVSANLCVAAVGTETNGSVIAPASHSGIVGIKPTVGLVSRRGIIPISKTQDTAGPMTRNVADAAILLGVLAGVDEEDRVTMESAGKSEKDYTVYLDANGLNGKRIGIEKTSLEGHEGVVALMNEAIRVMKSKGAIIVEVELLKPVRDSFGGGELAVLQYEFKDGLNRYLSKANGGVKSLADVIAFNKQNESKSMPFFKQETLEASQAKGDLDSKEYRDALIQILGTRKFIDGLMKQHNLDAISGVSLGPARPIDLINGDSGTGYYFCPPAAMAGYPHITVPMGLIQVLPVGISFMSGAYREPDMIKIAYAYEQASKKRSVPGLMTSSIPA